MPMTNSTTEPGVATRESSLPKHLLAVIEPQAPAKVTRPQVAKHRFSRSAKQARREDGVDTSVTVRRVGVPVPPMTRR